MTIEHDMNTLHGLIMLAYVGGDDEAARKYSGELAGLYHDRDGFFRGRRNFKKALQATVIEAERMRAPLYYEQCMRDRGYCPWLPASPVAFTPEECAVHEAHRHIRDMSELPAGICPVCGARNWGSAETAKELGLSGSETLQEILEGFTKK